MDSGFVCMGIVAAGIVIMPLVIIKLAKAMKNLKSKEVTTTETK